MILSNTYRYSLSRWSCFLQSRIGPSMVRHRTMMSQASETDFFLPYIVVSFQFILKRAWTYCFASLCTLYTHVLFVLQHRFGNLVTMAWWDDLWLNEGFASWAENYAADQNYPDYEMWPQFVNDHLSRALKLGEWWTVTPSPTLCRLLCMYTSASHSTMRHILIISYCVSSFPFPHRIIPTHCASL